MKTKIISTILIIILAITFTAIAGDYDPLKLTTDDWAKLSKNDRQKACLYYLIILYQQGRFKDYIRREFNNIRGLKYMSGKISRMVSISIIKETAHGTFIPDIAMAEMAVLGWL